MPIELIEAKQAIESEGFSFKRSTTKVVEYASTSNGRVLYLRLSQGFPNHADVAIHPKVDATALYAIRDVEPNKRVEMRFSSNMAKFPKLLNGGKKPEHFGRAFCVLSASALSEFCREYGSSS